MSQNQSQLWAKHSMNFKQHHKCQKKWANYRLELAWVLNNTKNARPESNVIFTFFKKNKKKKRKK
jgi:hypothetical protein